MDTSDAFRVGDDFTNILHKLRSQKQKKCSQVVCLFFAFGIFSSKSFLWNVGEIDPT